MKETAHERIVELEWANYAASLPSAAVTPGMEVILREDLILTRCTIFPTPDVNHACLLRTPPEAADALIDEIITYFQSQELPPTVFLSPACTPRDLPQRLAAHGFVRQESEEAWMVLDIRNISIPDLYPAVPIKQITKQDALTFAEIFMEAFEMPTDAAPAMAQLLEPSINLPGFHHYLALVQGQPVGTCSLICHETFGILGSAGVVPAHRRSGAVTNLTITAITEARREGVEALILQTAAGTLLERLLSISGFKKLFTRVCYTLP